ncbi:Uncharacterised protein [Legionella lansingensis]|uniref:Uncharacterized protein n=1 Tax=Legionella lansingensis TaxID=45067 RepID=A0A0W0VRL9_9GAMM|nr:hypothetical protein [Legionella lansingensis]KTD22836.1 hypothetical protein Llan_1077 [Legionella lansingensis]SNV49627.1 Uncharacterised protein [Legionella lansingensis]
MKMLLPMLLTICGMSVYTSYASPLVDSKPAELTGFVFIDTGALIEGEDSAFHVLLRPELASDSEFAPAPAYEENFWDEV